MKGKVDATYVAFYKFGQIYVPDFEGYRECE
jgi:hypothetical protein